MIQDIVLVNGHEGLADAMAGTSLLGQTLYVDSSTHIGGDNLAEIERIAPEYVYLVGGEGVLGVEIEEQLEHTGVTVIRFAGRTRQDTARAVSEFVNPTEPPDIEVPPIDPPPDGLYIPKLQGPILKHDGNPQVLGNIYHNDGQVHTYQNVLINGTVRSKGGGTLIRLLDFEIDGKENAFCARGEGGKLYMRRGELHNAEDGVKNSVDATQVTVHNLWRRSGGHLDCQQAEGTTDSIWRYSYLDVESGNAVVMAKSDLAPGANQKVTIEDSYMDGGNYTIKVNIGPREGWPTVKIRRNIWGGTARYGVRAGQIAEWKDNVDMAGNPV